MKVFTNVFSSKCHFLVSYYVFMTSLLIKLPFMQVLPNQFWRKSLFLVPYVLWFYKVVIFMYSWCYACNTFTRFSWMLWHFSWSTSRTMRNYVDYALLLSYPSPNLPCLFIILIWVSWMIMLYEILVNETCTWISLWMMIFLGYIMLSWPIYMDSSKIFHWWQWCCSQELLVWPWIKLF